MKFDDEWFNSLAKPKFQPPRWVFFPVWTFLYICMFLALFIIVFAHFKWTNIFSYVFFILQFYVNLQWPVVFFKEHNLRKAFLIAALLNFLVFLTMMNFFQISFWAGLLFLPYFLWCCFATILTFEILELNEW